MSEDHSHRWTRCALELLSRREGNRIVYVTSSGNDGASLAWLNGNVPKNFELDATDADSLDESDLVRELTDAVDNIDLLYLDVADRFMKPARELNLQVYQRLKPRLQRQSLVMVNGTDIGFGGNGELVVPACVADGMEIVLWGKQTLLARLNDAESADFCARVGSPVPRTAGFSEATRLHEEGRLWEAQAIYERIRHSEPDHIGACHLLGVVQFQRGRHEEALDLIGKAIKKEPHNARHFNNYGAVLEQLGRTIEAFSCFRVALLIQPGYADALANLGLVQQKMGQIDDALFSLEAALKIKPNHADALTRLHALHRLLGKTSGSIK